MLLLVEVLVLLVRSHCSSQLHYVTPDYGTTCPSEPCYTLTDYLVQNSSERFGDNTTVVFLNGVHHLNSAEHIVIRDVKNLTLVGAGNPGNLQLGIIDEFSSTVRCEYTSPSGFFFLNVSRLTISNLTIEYCGASMPVDVLQESFVDHTNSFLLFSPLERAAMVIINTFNLNMSGVVIQLSTGFGLLGLNILGDSSIKDSGFLYNNFNTYTYKECFNLTREELYYICTGGNAILGFVDTTECPEVRPTYSLQVTSSFFVFGSNIVERAVGAGLTMAFAQTSYGLHVNIDNTTAVRNSASRGANLAFVVYDVVDNSSITIQNTYSGDSNPSFITTFFSLLTGRVFVGGGMFYHYGRPLPTSFAPTCNPSHTKNEGDILRISNCQFVENRGTLGGGVSILFATVESTGIVHQITIENSLFHDNEGSPGSALYLFQIEPIGFVLLVRFMIENCTFHRNTYPLAELPNSVQQFELDLLNVVQLLAVQDVTFSECNFQDNNGSAIYAFGSKVRLSGSVMFERNQGISGGGLALHGNSLVLLPPNTTVNFINNSAALRGGGIFIESSNYRARSLCFFQFDRSDFTRDLGIAIYLNLSINSSSDIVNIAKSLNISVNFKNNTATEAGTAVYGGDIDTCFVVSTIHLRRYTNSGEIFNQLFHFEDVNGNGSEVLPETSLISSDPFRVCLCNTANQSDCDIPTYNVSIHSGQTFEVSALALGQRNGSSPGVVYGDFLAVNGTFRAAPPILSRLQQTQEIGKTCTTLRYTVLSSQPSLRMILAVEDSSLQVQPTYISITVLPCPPGFELTGDPPTCECKPLLKEYGITCNIDSGTIHRIAPFWMSKEIDSTHDQHSIVVHQYCPFDYCIPGDFDVNLSDPDSQCAYNRTGVLCGACDSELSITLGTSQCSKCSNDFLSLLIPFALAGLLLVLLLFVCDALTVSVGTTNGLIFYANIIQINQQLFFPPGHSNLLTVFIAWLNLDLGIKTCFYNGMDKYAKTWLQFVFPVYIWAIVGIIILLSHYSTAIAKLCGNHAVSVLATLFLLSFAKLQRTIITALSFTFLPHSDSVSNSVVWLYDGNIGYLQGKHIYLFAVALVVFLFISLPFTFFLFLSPWLLSASSHRALGWINKFKPLFDAYQGPYKDKHRYWPGFLLLVRGILFLIFSFNVLHGPNVILLVIIVAMNALSVFGWVGGGVYRQWPLNALEFTFFLNLGILAATTSFIRFSGGSQAAAVYTSVTVAFLIFVGILIYSIHHRLSPYLNLYQLCKKCFHRQAQLDLRKQPLPEGRGPQMHELVQTESEETGFNIELREPLIDSGLYTS